MTQTYNHPKQGTTEEILAVAKRKGSFTVDKHLWRFYNLRRKLRKLANKPDVPLKFVGCTSKDIYYTYAPEKIGEF